MKIYKKPYTDKFPYQYTVESSAYIVHTCVEAAHINLVNQVNDKHIEEFTPEMINKLNRASVFKIIKKG